jgi:uncharacterized peroxidase-related enzyme
MPHIALPGEIPGIRSLFEYRPQTAGPLLALAEAMLHSEETLNGNSLTRGERELIASYVSRLNNCGYCEATHSAFAAVQLEDDWALVEAVKNDPATAPISPKLRTLLALAAKVQADGRGVEDADIRAARESGANDLEIHDTVLIAAAFCMYNRYVDGLATWTPSNDAKTFEPRARVVAEDGYLAPVDYAHYIGPAHPDETHTVDGRLAPDSVPEV